MANTKETPTSVSLTIVTIIVWFVAICAVIDWSFFHRDKPLRLRELVAKNYATLSEVVGHENTYSPTTDQEKGKKGFYFSKGALLAIVGDGIAGVAAAINSPITDVRLFGSRSYWEELHGVPEVWQSTTSLDKAFVDAKFEKPSNFDQQEKGAKSTRLMWIAVERSRLLALEKTEQREWISLCA